MRYGPVKHLIPFLLLLIVGCTATKPKYDPYRKFGPRELQADYTLFRRMLEEAHPSLYWYTPKDSVDRYFDLGYAKLTDSMPEYKFRNVLSYVLAKIRCGHTTVRQSKEAVKYSERTRSMLLPLSVKAWEDTVVITANLSRRDSNVQRGVILRSIDGRPIQAIVDTFFQHLSADGYNTTHKYQTISNTGVFRNLYAYIYGIRPRTPIEYIDTAGHLRSTMISLASLVTDSAQQAPVPTPSRKDRRRMERQSIRSLRIDTSLNTAFMDLSSFSKGNGLRRFFRTSFHRLKKEHVTNLVVDLRANGGGSVGLSNLLTKYLADQPFKIADSLYAITTKSRYKQYRNNYLPYRFLSLLMTHRKKDGLYHFTYFENRFFKPKRRYHFQGQTYILTGGNTFSAATLFTGALIRQDDVLVVGEETGGGAYGNTAWLIPDATLPNTHVRFRLPLFRLVVDRGRPRGRGIMPEVEVHPTVADIRRNADVKMERVIGLIQGKKSK